MSGASRQFLDWSGLEQFPSNQGLVPSCPGLPCSSWKWPCGGCLSPNSRKAKPQPPAGANWPLVPASPASPALGMWKTTPLPTNMPLFVLVFANHKSSAHTHCRIPKNKRTHPLGIYHITFWAQFSIFFTHYFISSILDHKHYLYIHLIIASFFINE